MATREEKLQAVEKLKTEIQLLKEQVEKRNNEVKQKRRSGSLLRVGLVLLIVAAGLCVAGYYIFK